MSNVFFSASYSNTMDILNDNRVKMYLSSLGGADPIRNLRTVCQCHTKDLPENAHNETAMPHDPDSIKVAAKEEKTFVGSIRMYITNNFYFDFDTIHYLFHKMFNCKDVHNVLTYHSVLEIHFFTHPPCAKYMKEDYYNLMLASSIYFQNFSLWSYLIKGLERILRGSFLYGNNEAVDLAFKKFFSFCVNVLQLDFYVSSKIGVRSLIMKCIESHLQKTKIIDILKKLLNMSFEKELDLQIPIIHFALLLQQI